MPPLIWSTVGGRDEELRANLKKDAAFSRYEAHVNVNDMNAPKRAHGS
jgi:hypothetical protein